MRNWFLFAFFQLPCSGEVERCSKHCTWMQTCSTRHDYREVHYFERVSVGEKFQKIKNSQNFGTWGSFRWWYKKWSSLLEEIYLHPQFAIRLSVSYMPRMRVIMAFPPKTDFIFEISTKNYPRSQSHVNFWIFEIFHPLKTSTKRCTCL